MAVDPKVMVEILIGLKNINVIEVEEAENGTNSTTSTYDNAGELTSSVLPSTASSPQSTTTYTYNANGDRTSSSLSSNSTSSPITTSATWNGANELTSYTSPTTSMTSATYNGEGLRTLASFSSASSGTTTEHYIYNQSTSLPELLTDSTNAYIYNSSIAPFEQVNLTTGVTTYLITDATGSARAVMSEEGKIEATTNYDAYGNPTTKEGLSSYTPFGFAGSYTDSTGLIYLINRYYDPATGQFISVDPLVAQTGQPYSYTGGDPVNLTDPSGMYAYIKKEFLGTVVNVGTPQQVMQDFRQNFKAVFPFPINGCDRVQDGAQCILEPAYSFFYSFSAWPFHAVGQVRIADVSAVSFSFIVDRNGYFDPVDSKITFSTCEQSGSVYLVQHGDAPKNHGWLNYLAPLVATLTWDQQAYNLANLAFYKMHPALNPISYGFGYWQDKNVVIPTPVPFGP